MTSVLIVADTFSGTGGTFGLATSEQKRYCYSAPKDAQLEWTERYAPTVIPFVNSQKGNFLPVTSFANWTILSYTNRYYGSFVLGADTVVPPPVRVNGELPRGKSKLTYKEFQAAKAKGEIVLQPHARRKYVAVCTPGLEFTSESHTQLVLSHNLLHDQFPKQPSLCPFDGDPRFYDATRDVWPSVLMTTNCYYKRYDGPGELKTPLGPADLEHMVRGIDAAIAELEPDTTLVTEARAEAAAGILDLSTTLAEAPETIKMIVEACRLVLMKYLEVRRKIDVLKKNNLSQGDLVSQISALWMQYRYGIMPNVYTIEDGLKYLDAELVKYQSVRTGKSTVLTLPSFDGWSALTPEVSLSERLFLKNRFDVESLTKSRAYLVGNALGTAWELIPLSFVIDWVLNVGDYITSLSAPQGSIQEACLSSFQIKPTRLEYSNPRFVGSTVSIEYSTYRAAVIKPTDHIGLSFRPELNWKRTLDALALMWSFTRRDFKRNLSKRIS